jgi:cutinase
MVMLTILASFSQGTAVMDGSIQALPAALMAKVYGVVLFGFTRNLQDGGRIPNYPTSQTLVFCAVGDLVCDGTLEITAAHLTYGVDAPAAASFLASKV